MGQAISAEEMEIYRRTARKRREEQQRLLARRRQRAWEVARRAARILKDEFKARKVVVFGSLVHEGSFSTHSDVDLAVWGVPAESFLRAVARVLEIDPEIPVDLVEAEEAQPSLKRRIEEEGVVL